jgi:hypothetical protein
MPWLTAATTGDFDGTPALPEGLEDVSGYPNLIEELMRRGATEEDLAKFTQLNILRVWEENERIAKRLEKIRKPSEMTWSDRVWKQNYYGLPYSEWLVQVTRPCITLLMHATFNSVLAFRPNSDTEWKRTTEQSRQEGGSLVG